METVRGKRRSSIGASIETNCGSLLRELEVIWTYIGESKAEKDRMLLELEEECMQVYKRKVEEAGNARARLHQSIAVKEAELTTLRSSLGETTTLPQTSQGMTLKEKLALITPQLEELRLEKLEREKLFKEIRSQIVKINGEITGYDNLNDSEVVTNDEDKLDLSMRKINEYQARLRTLQKEKSDRVRKVLEYVNEVHCLCGVLGVDFGKTLDEVHPDLHECDKGQTTNISNSTLDGLSQTIDKLKREKKARAQKLRGYLSTLYELWSLMDTPQEDRRHIWKISFINNISDDDIKDSGLLSVETLQQVTTEVERLTKLKTGRMKQLVFNKRMELEEICRQSHIEPDSSTVPEKISALMDSGIVDPSQLIENIENHIAKAKEESISRKDIMDRVAKWFAACEEEKWLEDYNQDDKRYSAGRGAHLNLKRAEKARITITKIPGIVDNLMYRTIAWEDERNKPFMYDGVPLVTILEEYKLSRHQKEEEERRYRDQKKLQSMLSTGKEATYGSKPSTRRSNSLGRRPNGMNVNGSVPTVPRRKSAGSATPDLLTPRSYSGRQNGYFGETRRLSTSTPNVVALQKGETVSSFASVTGSEPGSPPLH